MTIIVFYPVDNALGWERDPREISLLEPNIAFKKMWEERDGLDAHFYNMDTRSYRDPLDGYGLLNAADFETDYNDELYDGGFWVQVFIVDRAFVKEVVSYGEQ